MSDPTGLSLAFDQPEGGYAEGATMTVTLSGTAGTTPEEYTLIGTLTKTSDPSVTQSASGTYTVNEIDQLQGSAGSDSGGRSWAPGKNNGQTGTAWSGTFTATA